MLELEGNDKFEQWYSDGLTPYAVEFMHSKELSDSYAEWIYFNEK